MIKLNKFIKAIGVSIVSLISLSCEKGFDYSIPENQITREEYNFSILKLLQAGNKDSVWVSNQQNARNLDFRIGLDFISDNTVKISNWQFSRKTLIQQLNEARTPITNSLINQLIGIYAGINDAQLRSLLLNNAANKSLLDATNLVVTVTLKGPPVFSSLVMEDNGYNINGDFQTNLTFESQSLLSDMKRLREFDFDFIMKNIKSNKIELFGHYGSNANRTPTFTKVLRQHFLDNVNAVNVLGTYIGTVDIKYNGKLVKNITFSQIKSNFKLSDDLINNKIVLELDKVINFDEIDNYYYFTANPVEYVQLNSTNRAVAGTVLASFNIYDGKTFSSDNVLEIIAK